MAAYKLTKLAVQDLSEIWEYTLDTWSERQADKYYEFILDTCNEIAQHPSNGKNYDIAQKGVLGWKTGEHIIFYKAISESEIEIIRILHGMMDLKRKI